jgi:ABC-type uncharacterized transport system permease subunit
MGSIWRLQKNREKLIGAQVKENWKLYLIPAVLSYSMDWCFVLMWKIFFFRYQIGNKTFEDFFLSVNLALGIVGITQFWFFGAKRLPFLIAERKIDYFYLRPAPILAQVLAFSHDWPSLGSVIFSLSNVCFLIPLSFEKKLLCLCLIFLGSLLLTSFLIIIGSFVFWVRNSELICSLIGDMLATISTYPQGAYPKFLLMFLYTIFPSAWLIQAPVQIIQNNEWIRLVALSNITLIYILLAFWIFQKGLFKITQDG